MPVTWADEAARWGYSYALHRKVYYMLEQLAQNTIAAKWPHARDLQINDPDQFDAVHLSLYIKSYIPNDILQNLEDFLQVFRADDRTHLLYTWVGSEHHISMIRDLDHIVGRYRNVAREVLNSAKMVAYNEELKLAIENGEIGCSYSYHITEDDILG